MNNHGFVRAAVMEGMIVIAIVAILAAIAIPQYMNYKNRPLNEETRACAYQAYKASQDLFRSNPDAKASLEDISRYGYRASPDIIVTIAGGKRDLTITATHRKAGRTYRIDSLGQLSTD